MSTKHYPYMGGSFDRIIFDGDGSVWVPEAENDKLREQGTRLFDKVLELGTENSKLRELVRDVWSAYHDGATNKEFRALPDRMRELGVDV